MVPGPDDPLIKPGRESQDDFTGMIQRVEPQPTAQELF